MKPRPWTAEEDAAMRRLYPLHSNPEIARQLGRTEPAILNRANKLGLKKPRGFANAGCFQPGIVPWNTGMKGWQAGGRSAESRFKKGELSGRARALLQPIGAERVTKDGILQRKVTTAGRGGQRWKSVHQLIWSAAHGPIQRGHIVVFKDGDKRNFAIGNLECISFAENMRRNSYHTKYPKEVGLAIQLLGAINRKINHATRRGTEETTA